MKPIRLRIINIYPVVLLCLIGCSKINSIDCIPKNIIINEDSILAEGRWKRTSLKGSEIIPELNSVSIVCDKKTMLCVESEALLIIPNERPILKNPLLDIQTFEYIVTRWTNELVKAERKPRAADVEIKISIVDKSITKHFRETKARGANTSNPEIGGDWILN